MMFSVSKNEVGKDKIYVAGNCVFMYNHGLDVFIEPGVKIKRPFTQQQHMKEIMAQ